MSDEIVGRCHGSDNAAPPGRACDELDTHLEGAPVQIPTSHRPTPIRQRIDSVIVSLISLCGLILPSMLFGTTTVWGQVNSFERPPIDYLEAEVDDPVARLAERLEAGEVELEFDGSHGYLRSVLAALEIPISSQTLVFSKTSLQLQRISPRRPRALYFNDDVYVGWCQRGDVLEFGSTDPQQGAIFYTLEQSPATDGAEPPRFIRDRGTCLTCHASTRTQNVPGYLVRSVFADAAGYPILGSGTFTTDHTSPFEERWGGWYVTGEAGAMHHLGNRIFAKDDRRQTATATSSDVESLDPFFTTETYLTPHSDLVALMVLEHQTQMHNAITAANYETRLALLQSFEMNSLLERPEGFISDSAERRIEAVADGVVRHLLMCDEFRLTNPVRGSTAFATEFAARGLRDSQGRSLRDFDLNERLFRYPCSYLIGSESFAALPDEVRGRIMSKLTAVLDGSDKSERFNHLSQNDRRAILEILRETRPELWID